MRMTIKEEMKGTDADDSPLIGKHFAEVVANMKPAKAKKKVKQKEKTTITFAEVRKYIKDLDFNPSDYRDFTLKKYIILSAEENNAPEEIINILLKLEDKHYHFYYEIQGAFNEIQQTELPALTSLEKIKEELDEQKEICNSKESRISHLESHLTFWRKVGWGTGYLFLVLIPIFLAYLQLWITIASDSGYNLFNVDLRQSATGWVLSSDASFFLGTIMVVFYLIIYGFLTFLWYICWHKE